MYNAYRSYVKTIIVFPLSPPTEKTNESDSPLGRPDAVAQRGHPNERAKSPHIKQFFVSLLKRVLLIIVPCTTGIILVQARSDICARWAVEQTAKGAYLLIHQPGQESVLLISLCNYDACYQSLEQRC